MYLSISRFHTFCSTRYIRWYLQELGYQDLDGTLFLLDTGKLSITANRRISQTTISYLVSLKSQNIDINAGWCVEKKPSNWWPFKNGVLDSIPAWTYQVEFIFIFSRTWFTSVSGPNATSSPSFSGCRATARRPWHVYTHWILDFIENQS